MKKLCFMILSVLLLLVVAGCGDNGPKKMVIGLDDNFAPMGFRNEKMKLSALILTWQEKPVNALAWKFLSSLSIGAPRKQN